MNNKVAIIDSFVAKAIYKIKIQLIVRGIHDANLRLRVTLKVNSFVDETISNKKHSMHFFFDNDSNQTLQIKIVSKIVELPQAIMQNLNIHEAWLEEKLAKFEVFYRKVIDYGVHTGINVSDSTAGDEDMEGKEV